MLTRLTLTAAVLVAFHLPGHSQVYKRSIGFTLLPGATTWMEPGYGYQSARFAPGLGIDVEQKTLSDILYLQTGLQIMDRGFRGKFADPVVGTSEFVIRNVRSGHLFITLPLNIVVRKKGVFLRVGGNIGYPLRRKLTIDRSISFTDRSFKPHLRLFGAQASIGYEFHAGERLLLSAGGFASTTFNPRFINVGIETGLKLISGKQQVGNPKDL